MECQKYLEMQNNSVSDVNEDTGVLESKNYQKKIRHCFSYMFVQKIWSKLTCSNLQEDIQQDLENENVDRPATSTHTVHPYTEDIPFCGARLGCLCSEKWKIENTHSQSVKEVSRTSDDVSLNSDMMKATMNTEVQAQSCSQMKKSSSFSTMEIFYGAVLKVTVVLCMMTTSSCEVELVPRNPIYYEGHNAVFTCNADGAVAVRWYYNETLEPFIHAEFSELLGVGILRIYQISGLFNGTTLQCEAVYSNNVALSDTSSILIQGTTAPVSDLRYIFVSDGQAHIFWRAPFTLDVSDNAIDVTYCVDIINTTSMESMYSKCDISKTDHTCKSFPKLVACAEYLISVKAENPVGNSSAMNMTARNEGLEIINFTQVNSTAISTRFMITMNKTYCPILTNLKAFGAIIEYIATSKRSIEFDLENNKHYRNITLEITYPTYEYESLGSLKTYDVKDLQVSSGGNNAILLQSHFVEHSRAVGVLYILSCVNYGSINFPNSSYLLISKEDAENGVKVEGIPSGVYLIMAYDIEHDGHLQYYGYPSTTRWINVNGTLNIDKTALTMNICSMTVNRLKIEVRCFCGSSRYQVLLQRNDGSIESVQNITTKRQSCLNATIFHVVKSGIYCATAFHNPDGDGILNSTVIFSHEFLVEDHSSISSPHSVVINSTSFISDSSYNENKFLSGPVKHTGIIIAFVLCILLIMIIPVIILIIKLTFHIYKKGDKKSISTDLPEDSEVRKSQPVQSTYEKNCHPVTETKTSIGDSGVYSFQLKDSYYHSCKNSSQTEVVLPPLVNKRYLSSSDITGPSIFDSLMEGGSVLTRSAPAVRGSFDKMYGREYHINKVERRETRDERRVALTRGFSESYL